jgi:hypothetical protein
LLTYLLGLKLELTGVSNSASPTLSMLLMEDMAEFLLDSFKLNRLKKNESPPVEVDFLGPSVTEI